MAKNIVFILTEGEHDAAFIYRILKANGLTSNHKIAIKDYPFPLNELIKNSATSAPITEELNMEVARSRFMPSYIMQKDDNVVSIYRIGGDSKDKVRTDFVKSINNFNTQEDDGIVVLTAKISILFFFDADNKGITNRIEQIKKELKSSFSKPEAKTIDKLMNKEIFLIDNVNVGGFIFAEEGKSTGLLEDILIPLMKQENEDIFEKAECFLEIHENTNLFRGKVQYDDTKTIKEKINGQKYAHKKSLVGTVGQLQMSGKSNSVCISDANYLNDAKIKSNSTCLDIYDFISRVL